MKKVQMYPDNVVDFVSEFIDNVIEKRKNHLVRQLQDKEIGNRRQQYTARLIELTEMTIALEDMLYRHPVIPNNDQDDDGN